MTTQNTKTTNDQTHNEYGVSQGWSGRGSLQDLVEELDRQRQTTHDFVCDTRNLAIAVTDGMPFLVPDGAGRQQIIDAGFLPDAGAKVSSSAIAQLGQRVAPKVPVKFLRELIDQRPAIAEQTLTALLHETAGNNLVRCLDGGVRAFLSDRYQPIDNYTLAFNALEAARDMGGEVVEASLTEHHMRIKLTSRSIFEALDEKRSTGDRRGWYAGGLGSQAYLGRVAARTMGELPGGAGTVHPMVTLGNSETGHGSKFARLGILRAICFNLATVENVITQVHLGSRMDPGILSQETIRLDTQATMAKSRDAVRAGFDPVKFRQLVDRCRAAQEVEVRPTQAVDFAQEQGIVSQEQRDSLLGYFIGGDVEQNTAYGFAQAIARLAQDELDPDKADELEGFAGKVIAKPQMVAAPVLA